MIKYILILPFLFITLIGASQDKVNAEEAANKMKLGNYEDALADYLQLLNAEPKNELYNYNAGICYINSNGNKAKAIPYLEIVTRKDVYNHEADYLLARAYHYGGRYDDAIKMYDNYKIYLLQKGKINTEINDEIQYCLNAKELVKYPVSVSFQSLGKNINSEFNDYYPFVTANESFIVYNTKRPEKNAEKLPNGEYGNSIFISKVVNGQYAKALSIGAPINAGNSGTEIIGLSANGETMLLLIYNSTQKGNIYVSTMQANGSYSKPELLGSKINSGGDEIAACVNQSGNTIFFASNRKGGFGGTDIYVCKKLPSNGGEWSNPQNAGPNINTPSDEDFPNISPDEKTLYFSSKGHASMGGYDIFKSNYDANTNTFSNAKNIGYPVNTAYDDMNFRVSKNGKYGYIAAIKTNGLGEYDIYRVNFNEIENDYSVIIGEFKLKENEKVNYSDVFISVNDVTTKELVGNYLPNPTTGRFIMILTPGKYQMSIEAAGFKTIEKNIEVLDKASYQSEINMNVELVK